MPNDEIGLLTEGQALSTPVEDGNGITERAKAVLYKINFCILRSFNGVFT